MINYRAINIFRITLLTIWIFSCYNSVAQQKNQDANFRKEMGKIDSLTSRQLLKTLDSVTARRNIKLAVDSYIDLDKKYKHADPISLLYLSIKGEHPVGFYNACKGMVRVSGDSTDRSIRAFGNIYGGNDMSVLNREPLASILKKVKAEEGVWIQQARTNLDWRWNIELVALFKSNIDIRYYPDECFKDEDGRAAAYTFIDSTHLFEFCELVEKHGYPYYSRVGTNASLTMAPLLHQAALLESKDKKQADIYLGKWKFLMPYLYRSVTTEGGDYGFYQRLYQSIINIMTATNRDDELKFFKQFEFHD